MLQLRILRQLHEAPDGSRTEMLMEDNFRPTMALNRRTIRTNIAPKEPVSTLTPSPLPVSSESFSCPARVHKTLSPRVGLASGCGVR